MKKKYDNKNIEITKRRDKNKHNGINKFISGKTRKKISVFSACALSFSLINAED
ncbi:MAG: hypothetical protein K6F77_03025 [Lachnospiraceae bacterium]|nr:hypothetical protein [Lachnospiraceae bacterium]